MNYQVIGRINKALTSSGFQSYKDVLGIYYTKTTHKFSIMKHGNAFICYYNINRDNQWVLTDKSNPFQDYSQAMMWVYERASKAL